MKKFLKVSCVMVMLFAAVSPSFGMTGKQRKECHWTIHAAAAEAAASAAALSQAPGADNIALAVIIGNMTIELAKVFDVSLTHSAVELGKNVLKQFAGTIAARVASQWVVGWIPFIGNAINAATMSGLVEYIGWDVAENFDENRWYWMN